MMFWCIQLQIPVPVNAAPREMPGIREAGRRSSALLAARLTGLDWA